MIRKVKFILKQIKDYFEFNNEEFRQLTLLEGRLAFTGLIALSFIIIQIWIATGTPDIPSKISLITLSISAPMLILTFMYGQIPRFLSKRYAHRGIYRFIYFSYFFFGSQSLAIALVGITFAIYHASKVAGWIFLLSSIFCTFFYLCIKVVVANSIEEHK
jgi:hypothetical protein